MSQGASDVGEKSDIVGRMMVGDNSGCDAAKASDSARQTVNYASYRDNYTLFDQYSATVASQKAYNICRATTSTNAAIMMSNGVAFMQGGEELFRTKIVSEEDAANIRLPEDYGMINGNKIAHNAYRCGDYTHAFDYSRKIQVTYGGETCTCSELYFNELAKIIKLRTKLEYKASPDGAGDPTYWGTGSNVTQVAYYIGLTDKSVTKGYVVLLNGCNSMATISNNLTTIFAKVGEAQATGSDINVLESNAIVLVSDLA